MGATTGVYHRAMGEESPVGRDADMDESMDAGLPRGIAMVQAGMGGRRFARFPGHEES